MDHREKIIHDFNAQFEWSRKYWLDETDILNWIRFFYLVKELITIEAKKILEIGEGSGVALITILHRASHFLYYESNKHSAFHTNPKWISEFWIILSPIHQKKNMDRS